MRALLLGHRYRMRCWAGSSSSCIGLRSTTQVILSMNPALHIHKCGVKVGFELTVCSLEVQSSNHVSFHCCPTRIKYLQLPLVLDQRRLAGTTNSATPPQKWSPHCCTTYSRAFCKRWDCWGSHDDKWPRAWAQVSLNLALNPLHPVLANYGSWSKSGPLSASSEIL